MALPTTRFEEPAYSVLERLGGKAVVSAELKIDQSTLSRWCTPKPGGTGGLIPRKHWRALMSFARKQKVSLTLRELAAL